VSSGVEATGLVTYEHADINKSAVIRVRMEIVDLFISHLTFSKAVYYTKNLNNQVMILLIF